MYFLNYDDPTKTSLAAQFGYTSTASKPNTNVSEEDWDPLGKARQYNIQNQKQLIAFQKRHMSNPSGVWDANFDTVYNQYVDSLKQYQKTKPSQQNSNQNKAPSSIDISNMPLFKQEDPVYLMVDGKMYYTVIPKIDLKFQQGRRNIASKFNDAIGQQIVTEDDFVDFDQYRYAYDPDTGCFRQIAPNGTSWTLGSRWLPSDGFKAVSKNTVDYKEKEMYRRALKRMGGSDDIDLSDPSQTMFLMDKQGGTLVQHRKQGGRLINKHLIGGPMNTIYNEDPEKADVRDFSKYVAQRDNTYVHDPYEPYSQGRFIIPNNLSLADILRIRAMEQDRVNNTVENAKPAPSKQLIPRDQNSQKNNNDYPEKKMYQRALIRAGGQKGIDLSDPMQTMFLMDKQGGVLNAFQQGGPMVPATAGPSGAQDIKTQVVQLVQAAMSGDQAATQQINQIMQAAQQGDAQAAQIAQIINQVAQEMQRQAPAARMGTKLSYIKSLKYARGGKTCNSKVDSNKCGGKAKKR